jgi:hypothetical protein
MRGALAGLTHVKSPNYLIGKLYRLQYSSIQEVVMMAVF